MVEARFQVYKDIADKYRFRLIAPNNKIVVVGESYERREGCLKGVNAVKKYCAADVEDLSKGEEKIPAPKFQVYKDRDEKFRFHLVAPNYEIVAVSEAYESKQSCIKGIETVKNYCGADVEDLTIVPTPSIEFEGDYILVLDEPASTVKNGSAVAFKGRLMRGKASIANEKINIYESDRSFMQDDYMASGTTDDNGYYKIEWKAKQMDWWDDTVEVYARYMESGSRRLIPITSETYTIRIT